MTKFAGIALLLTLLVAPSPASASRSVKKVVNGKTSLHKVKQRVTRTHAKGKVRPLRTVPSARLEQAKLSHTGRSIQGSSLPHRIKNRALNTIRELQAKGGVTEANKTFGTQLKHEGFTSKFVMGKGKIVSPTETTVLLKGKQELTITRKWGHEVGSQQGRLVESNQGYGPKVREHEYSISPRAKGVLLEISTSSFQGKVVNRRAYEVHAATGKRIGELQNYRIN